MYVGLRTARALRRSRNISFRRTLGYLCVAQNLLYLTIYVFCIFSQLLCRHVDTFYFIAHLFYVCTWKFPPKYIKKNLIDLNTGITAIPHLFREFHYTVLATKRCAITPPPMLFVRDANNMWYC